MSILITLIIVITAAVLLFIAVDYLPAGNPKLNGLLKFIILTLCGLFVLAQVVGGLGHFG